MTRPGLNGGQEMNDGASAPLARQVSEMEYALEMETVRGKKLLGLCIVWVSERVCMHAAHDSIQFLRSVPIRPVETRPAVRPVARI